MVQRKVSRRMTIRKKTSFGKKKRTVRKTLRKTVRKSTKPVKRPSAVIRRRAKKYGVRITVGKAHPKYKKESLIEKQIRMKKSALKKAKKTIKSQRKTTRKSPRKTTKRTVRKTIRKSPRKTVKRSRFGKLEVPGRMRSVSELRANSRFNGRTPRPLLIAPFGPPQPWMLKDETPAYSGVPSFGMRTRTRTRNRSRNVPRIRTRFGSDSLAGRRVNPSGYLSLWEGSPVIAPPSWNYLLRQGANQFREGINDPTLSNVGLKFGKKKKRKSPVKKTKKRTTKKN